VPLTLLRMAPEHQAAVVEMGISDFGEMARLAASGAARQWPFIPSSATRTLKSSMTERAFAGQDGDAGFLLPEGTVFANGDDDLLRRHGMQTEKGAVRHWGKITMSERAENIAESPPAT
jgi:UDP-N-acetylmuramoyl-tripeptide--D-alanyl-D-alanine ligase